MTPLELCEPIFTRVCVLNRLGRNQGGLLTYDQLRLEIEQLLAGIRNTAEADPALESAVAEAGAADDLFRGLDDFGERPRRRCHLEPNPACL